MVALVRTGAKAQGMVCCSGYAVHLASILRSQTHMRSLCSVQRQVGFFDQRCIMPTWHVVTPRQTITVTVWMLGGKCAARSHGEHTGGSRLSRAGVAGSGQQGDIAGTFPACSGSGFKPAQMTSSILRDLFRVYGATRRLIRYGTGFTARTLGTCHLGRPWGCRPK